MTDERLRQVIIEEFVRAANACRHCGEAHQWRDETYRAPNGATITRGTWAHPVDNHTYYRTMPEDVSAWLQTFAEIGAT